MRIRLRALAVGPDQLGSNIDIHLLRRSHRTIDSSSIVRTTALIVGSMPVSFVAACCRVVIFSYSSELTRTAIWGEVSFSIGAVVPVMFGVDKVDNVS